MSLLTILKAVVFLASAFAVGIYAWRGLRKGKILVGIRGGREAWMMRREDPVSYWIVMLLCALVIGALLWMAIHGLTN